jgi:hypothetical protein
MSKKLSITIISILLLIICSGVIYQTYFAPRSLSPINSFSKMKDGKQTLFCKTVFVIKPPQEKLNSGNIDDTIAKTFIGYELTDQKACPKEIEYKNTTKAEIIKSMTESKDLGILEAIAQ